MGVEIMCLCCEYNRRCTASRGQGLVASSSQYNPMASLYRTCVHALFCIFVCSLCELRSAEAVVYTVPLYKLDAKFNKAVQVDAPSQYAMYDTPTLTTQHWLPYTKGNLEGQPGEGYYVEMVIGTPPQKLNILIDTGSSNFAVAAAPHPSITTYFNRSQSSTYTSYWSEVHVPYTQGSWTGVLGKDFVSLTSVPNVTVETTLAFITESENFFMNGSEWQGILGLAYAEIARPDSSLEPFFDALVEQMGINSIFSIQLCGTIDSANGSGRMSGNLVLGGIDDTLYKGEMYYVPIYKEWYYEVVMTDISVNGVSANMDCKEYNFDKTIVDSGTTNLRLPKKVFSQVLAMIEANTSLADQIVPDTFWLGDKLLCWSKGFTPWKSFPSIEITLAMSSNSTMTLTLSSQQYLRAVSREEEIDTSTVIPDQDCYKFAVSPSETGTVLGAVVMEAFYVVFDREQKRVGFAVNTCPNKVENAIHPKIAGPTYREDTMDCAYIKPENHQSTLLTVAYVMAGICAFCLLPIVILFMYWQVQRCNQEQEDEILSTNDNHGLLKDDASER